LVRELKTSIKKETGLLYRDSLKYVVGKNCVLLSETQWI
jgi:hypothetical protein